MLALGKFPGLDGFLAAGGCSDVGIATSSGAGRSLAELAVGQTPTFDLEPHRLDRFGSIDPFAPAFWERRGQARSGKVSG